MKITLLKRDVTGKKVKNIREDNLVPASIYGPEREPANVQVRPLEFRDLFRKAGYSNLIDVEIEGETGVQKALIKEVQIKPIKANVLHVSFYQVNMKKPIIAEVPVRVEGESPAVKNNLGLLVAPVNSVQVHCLPGDIPSEIRIDISELKEVGSSILISSIKLPENVNWGSHVSLTEALAYISAPQKKVEEDTSAVEVAGAVAEGAEAPAEAAKK